MRIFKQLTAEEERDLERAQESHDTARAEQEEEREAYEEAPETVRRYRSVIRAVRAMLSRRTIDVSTLTELSDDERSALRELREAIEGRRNGNYYYAEDRLDALNGVLAVLQPILSVAMLPEAADLQLSFQRVRDELNTLRSRLSMIDAVEDHELNAQAEKKSDDEDDDDDDEGDDGDEADGGGEGEGEAAAKRKKAPGDDEEAGDDADASDADAPDTDEPTP